MKKKIGLLFTAITLMTAPAAPLTAADYSYTGGNGYQQYRTAPNLAPGIALGIIALAAIIGVAIVNMGAGHATVVTP